MRKRIIVMILSACLLLAAGCSETEPPIDISEPSETPASSSVLNPGEPSSNSIAEESESGQEQSLSSILATDSRPALNASVFLGANVNLGDHAHLMIDFQHSPFYALQYHEARKFLLGIDFSQFEPLEGNYEEYRCALGGFQFFSKGWRLIEGHVHHSLEFRLPWGHVYALAVHSVSEIYLDESGDFQSNTRYYFYSISPEFYFNLRDRLEEFSQYGLGWGGALICIEWSAPIIDAGTFFEDLNRLSISFSNVDTLGDDFRSRNLWLSCSENAGEVEEFVSGIDFSQLKPIDENDERYDFDTLANLASFSATGIRMSDRFDSLWLNMRWGYGYEGVAVFNMFWHHTAEDDDYLIPPGLVGSRSFYSISQEFYDAVLERIEEFWELRQS